jgi:hypothetical protein
MPVSFSTNVKTAKQCLNPNKVIAVYFAVMALSHVLPYSKIKIAANNR